MPEANKFHIIYLSQLMGLWYLSHRRPAKAQASLRICAFSPQPLLVAYMKYGSRRRRVGPKIRHVAPLDAHLKNEFTEDEKYHNLMTWFILIKKKETAPWKPVLQLLKWRSRWKVKAISLPSILVNMRAPGVDFGGCTNEPPHDKTNKMTVRPTKTLISLGIRQVWSVFAVRSMGS